MSSTTEFDSQRTSLSIGEKDFSRLYYYDCHIKMAYMAKYFGMKFVAVLHESWGINVTHELKERYYINSNDLSLLEAREGDVVSSGLSYHFLCGNSGIFGTPIMSLSQVVGPEGMKVLRIITRNGISFIWPEVSA